MKAVERGNIRVSDAFSVIADASRRESIFFRRCNFCGGYDDIETDGEEIDSKWEILASPYLGLGDGHSYRYDIAERQPEKMAIGPQMANVRYIQRISRATTGDIDLDIQKRKSWPGITAEFVRFTPPEEFDFRLAKSSNFIALLNIYRADGETVVPDLPRSYKKDLRNRITFIPHACEIGG